MRSVSGQGEKVRVYVVDADAAGCGYEPADENCMTVAEDYAVSHWPVVVKAKLDVSQQQLVRHLRYLASVLDCGDPRDDSQTTDPHEQRSSANRGGGVGFATAHAYHAPGGSRCGEQTRRDRHSLVNRR